MSRERMFNIASRIVEEIKRIVELPDEQKVKSVIVKTFGEEIRVIESIDAEVRSRILRMSKPIAEGSGEWKALYERYFDEEWRRRIRV